MSKPFKTLLDKMTPMSPERRTLILNTLLTHLTHAIHVVSKREDSSAHITLFSTLELWWRKGSWYRPGEWVFMIDRTCHNKCIIVEAGFCGVTWLLKDCKGLDA